MASRTYAPDSACTSAAIIASRPGRGTGSPCVRRGVAHQIGRQSVTGRVSNLTGSHRKAKPMTVETDPSHVRPRVDRVGLAVTLIVGAAVAVLLGVIGAAQPVPRL